MNLNVLKVATSILFFLAFMSTSNANAALVSIDLVPGSGDHLVTRDTDTNLDWLNVTLTANQTYDQVRTGIYYSQGFRHATIDDLQLLFTHAGLVNDGFDISVTQPTEANALTSLLGSTIIGAGRLSTAGFTGNDYFGNVVTLSNYPIGTSFSALLGKIDFIDLTASGNGIIGEAHFTGGHPFSDEASPYWGSYLVRDGSYLVPDAACRTAGNSPNPKCNNQAQGQYK